MKYSRLLLLVSFLLPLLAAAQQPAAEADQPAFRAMLTKSVSTKKSKAGDEVVLKVMQEVKDAKGVVLIPKKAQLVGNLVKVTPNESGDKRAFVTFGYDWFVVVEGQRTPLRAFVNGLSAPNNDLEGGYSPGMMGGVSATTANTRSSGIGDAMAGSIDGFPGVNMMRNSEGTTIGSGGKHLTLPGGTQFYIRVMPAS